MTHTLGAGRGGQALGRRALAPHGVRHRPSPRSMGTGRPRGSPCAAEPAPSLCAAGAELGGALVPAHTGMKARGPARGRGLLRTSPLHGVTER